MQKAREWTLRLKKNIRQYPFLLLVIFFVILNIASRTGGGTNEYSRLATMRAMSEQFTFKINDYVDWTIDWAQTPDGSYYSNKAPGPMLLGFPLFFVLDKISGLNQKEIQSRKMSSSGNGQSIRPNIPGPTTRSILSLVMQVLPLAFLVGAIGIQLAQSGYSLVGINFFVLAALIGNTAAIFVNSYFGHAFAAQFLLATYFFYFKRNYLYLGLCLGLAILSEYTAALLMPILIVGIFLKEKNIKWVKKFVCGGIFPGVLWCWYHFSATGSIFKVTAQFQNPKWQNMLHEKNNLWGIFSFNLNGSLFYELLLGNSRGILFTQPWFLLVLLAPFLLIPKQHISSLKKLSFVGLLSFLVLLIMNTTFGGWHGGHSSGPRYLSMLFPACGFLAALYWDYLPKWWHLLAWFGLIPALVLRALIYGSTTMAHDHKALWPFLWNFMQHGTDGRGEMRFYLFSGFLLIIAGIVSLMTMQKLKTQSKISCPE